MEITDARLRVAWYTLSTHLPTDQTRREYHIPKGEPHAPNLGKSPTWCAEPKLGIRLWGWGIRNVTSCFLGGVCFILHDTNIHEGRCRVKGLGEIYRIVGQRLTKSLEVWRWFGTSSDLFVNGRGGYLWVGAAWPIHISAAIFLPIAFLLSFTYSFFAMVIDTLCILSAKNFLPIGVLLVEIFPHFIKDKRQRGQNDNEYVGHL